MDTIELISDLPEAEARTPPAGEDKNQALPVVTRARLIFAKHTHRYRPQYRTDNYTMPQWFQGLADDKGYV